MSKVWTESRCLTNIRQVIINERHAKDFVLVVVVVRCWLLLGVARLVVGFRAVSVCGWLVVVGWSACIG